MKGNYTIAQIVIVAESQQDQVETVVLQENIEKPEGLIFLQASAGICFHQYYSKDWVLTQSCLSAVLQENIEKPKGLIFLPASAGIFLLPYLFQNRDLSRFCKSNRIVFRFPFLLKSFGSMMSFLVTDVVRNHIDITGRNRKCPISILPAETIITKTFFVDHKRRHAFYIMGDFCWAEVRISSQQYMDMVIGPVNFQQLTS
jgi:hypothetical protein